MSGSINTDATAGAVFRQAQATANRLTRANMNIPELIMAIQMERANVLENQVMGQMEDMQKRNEWLRDANAALAALRTARPNDTSSKVDYSTITFTDVNGQSRNVLEWAANNGVETGMDWPTIKEGKDALTAMDGFLANDPGGLRDYPSITRADGTTVQVNRWGSDSRGYTGFDRNNSDNVGYRDEAQGLRDAISKDLTSGVGGMDQAKFDAAIQNAKAAIDTANTNSQMDMVRLQGLMDKRNQTFDLMTNTLSKTGKSMDGTVGNMR